ncbi:MAG: hypothetical protein ABI868_07785 [Acidobacteriota bacterium]
MPGRRTVRAELEEQRLIIERQQVELLRQEHHLEMQRRRTAHLEAQLDAVAVALQRVAFGANPADQQSDQNGNGHHDADDRGSETNASSD